MDNAMLSKYQEHLTPEQLQELDRILNRFVGAYEKKTLGQTDEEWLRDRLLSELPELGTTIAGQYSQETMMAIQAYNETLSSLNSAREHGMTVAEWFFKRTRWAYSSLTVPEYASKMLLLHSSVEQITQVQSTGSEFQGERADGEDTKINVSDSEAEALAKMTGEQVRLAGLQSVVEASEYVEQIKRPIVERSAVIHALETGETKGLKVALAGALTTASGKQVIQIASIETSMPIETCADLASMVVENARASVQLARKKISVEDTVDQKAANAVAFLTRSGIRAIGGTIGKVTGRVPIIGPVMKSAVYELTRSIEKQTGEKVAEAVEKARHPIAVTAKKAVAKVSNVIQAGVQKSTAIVKSLKNKIADLIHR